MIVFGMPAVSNHQNHVDFRQCYVAVGSVAEREWQGKAREESQGNMKMKVIGYWATALVVVLELLAGGMTDLIHGRTSIVSGEPVVQVLAHVGYPAYLDTILGMWKLLGGSVLLVPGVRWSRNGHMLVPSSSTWVLWRQEWSLAAMIRPRSSGRRSCSPCSRSLRGYFGREAGPLASTFPHTGERVTGMVKPTDLRSGVRPVITRIAGRLAHSLQRCP